LGPERLDGDRSVKEIVVTEKDFGHPAFADFALNLVAPVDDRPVHVAGASVGGF
jgi:hypothetical protein